MDSGFLLGKLPAYQGKKILVKKNQNTDDIIQEMLQAHKLHRSDYDRISAYFWKGNLKDTGQFIFDFLKKNVKYSIEPDHRQSVKSPASILSTGYYKNGFNDCKHYSQFISGILDSLKRSGKNINWFYRFANYRVFTNQPQHVFVVASDGKNEFWIDPVLKTFDERKNYINKIDKKMLYQISGFENNELNDFNVAGIGRRKARAKKPKKERKGIFKKIKNVLSKVNLAPSRAAFLGIIKLNPFKIANTLYAKLQNPNSKAKLLKKWKNLGGNPGTFEKTIVKQYNHWKKRKGVSGIGNVSVCGNDDELGYIGLVDHIIRRKIAKRIKARRMKNRSAMPAMPARPVLTPDEVRRIRENYFRLHPRRKKYFRDMAVKNMAGIGAVQLVAVLAVAAPIIAALAEFLPKGMKNKADAAAAQVPEVVQAQAAAEVANTSAAVPPGMSMQRMAVNVSDDGNERTQTMKTEKEADDDGEVLPAKKGNNNTLLYLGGGGLLLFALSRK